MREKQTGQQNTMKEKYMISAFEAIFNYKTT